MRGVVAAAALLVAAAPLAAQDPRHEVWPETDVWVATGIGRRLLFLATTTKAMESDGAYREGTIGVHYDMALARRLLIGFFKASDNIAADRTAPVSVRFGYRYGASLGDGGAAYQEHRLLGEVHNRFALARSNMVSNRVRLDLRWLDGDLSTRVRDRLQLERDVTVAGYRFVIYGSGEIYYDSRYDAFNRNRVIAGTQLPFSRVLMVDLYYARQNDSQASITHVNGYGMALNLSY